MDEEVKFFTEGLGMKVVRQREVNGARNVFVAYGEETLADKGGGEQGRGGKRQERRRNTKRILRPACYFSGKALLGVWRRAPAGAVSYLCRRCVVVQLAPFLVLLCVWLAVQGPSVAGGERTKLFKPSNVVLVQDRDGDRTW